MDKPKAGSQALIDMLRADDTGAAGVLVHLLKQYPDQLWVFDESLAVVFCNTAGQAGDLGCVRGSVVEDFPPPMQLILQRGAKDCRKRGTTVSYDEKITLDIRGTGQWRFRFWPLAKTLVACTIHEQAAPERVIESLKRNEARLTAILNAIPDLMFRFNRDGVYIDYWAGDESQLVAPPGEFIGRHLSEVLPPELATQTLASIERAVTTGELQLIEYTLPIGDQQTFWEARMVKSGPGEVLVITRNITKAKQAGMESRRLSEELAQANEELNATNEELEAKYQELAVANQEVLDSQEALQQLARRNEALLAAVPDIIMEVNENKVYTWSNEAGLAFFGDDVIGKEAAHYFEGEQDTYDVVEPLFLGDESMVYIESWQRRRDGEKRLLAWWCRILTDSTGSVTGALSTARDITKQRHVDEELLQLNEELTSTNEELRAVNEELEAQYEELVSANEDLLAAQGKLRESEERYRSVVNNVGEGIAVVDETETFAYANPAAERIFGMESGTLAGRSLFEFVGKEQHNLVREETEMRRCGASSSYELTITQPGGEQRHIYTTVTPKVDADGNYIGAHGFYHDITERKQAEEALKESEGRFRAMFELHSSMMLLIDPLTGVIVDANASATKFYGYSRDQLQAMNIDQINQLPAEEVSKKRLSALSREQDCFIFPHRMASGEIKWVEVQSAPIEVRGKALLFSIIHDITERKQVEEETRKLAEIIKHSSELVNMATLDGMMVFLNKAGSLMLGIEPEEVESTSIMEVIPDHLKELVENEVVAALRKGNIWEGELQYRNVRTGELTDVYAITFPVKDPDTGEPQFLANVSLDITERKLAEVALQESEERYRRVVENAREFIWQVDTEGKFVFFNHFAEKVSGQKSADWQGKHFAPIIHTDELAYVMEVHEKVVAGHTVDYETRIINDKGEPVDLEVQAIPIYAKRDVVGTISFGRDITKRKQAEEALKESEEKYRELVDNMGEGMLLVDESETILFSNPAAERIFGVEPGSLTGRNWRDFTTPEQFAIIESKTDERLKGHTSSYTIEIKRTDDTKRMLRVTASPRFDSEGNFIGSFGPIHDITEQLKLEQHLRQSQKLEAIGTLAGGIAHDFNNLLFAMLANTEMALGELPADSGARHNLKEIIRAGRHAKELVRQILSFARHSEQPPELIQTAPVIRDVLRLLRATFPTTVEIRHHIDPAPVSVLADPTQIHQVLLNLCTNARQAMADDAGVLEVTAAPVVIEADVGEQETILSPGRYLFLQVQDNGCGIEPGDLERVFEPFFTTKKPGEGTGMGLAVVHGIITAMAGAITVESEVGVGSTFRVYLPVVETGVEAGATDEKRQIPRGNERILLVDDDETIARASGKILQRLGYQVTVLTSSEDALAAIRKAPDGFDLLITDQTMPHLTGVELATAAKLIKPNLPVILCSGYSKVVSAEDAAGFGIDEYLMKPFGTAELALAIRGLLD